MKKSEKGNEPDTRFPIDPDLIGEYVAEYLYILPVYLLLEKGEYNVHVGARKGTVWIDDVSISTPISKFLKTDDDSRICIPGVRHDPFNRTQVRVWFEPTLEEIRLLNTPDAWVRDPFSDGSYEPLLCTSLEFVNKLIQAYQVHSGDETFERVQPWEIGYFKANMKIPKKHLIRPIHEKFIGGGGRPIAIIKGTPPKYDISDRIRKTLSKNWRLPIHKQLLMTARYLYLRGDYSTALITSQTALESYLGNRLHMRGIQQIKVPGKSKLVSVRKIGLTNLCYHGLKALCGKSLKELNKKTNSDILKIQRKRNRIIHEGMEATILDADFTIKVCTRAIEELGSI